MRDLGGVLGLQRWLVRLAALARAEAGALRLGWACMELHIDAICHGGPGRTAGNRRRSSPPNRRKASSNSGSRARTAAQPFSASIAAFDPIHNQRALATHWTHAGRDPRLSTIASFNPQSTGHSPEQIIQWDVESANGTGDRLFRVREMGLRAAEAFGSGLIGKTMEELVPPALRAISRARLIGGDKSFAEAHRQGPCLCQSAGTDGLDLPLDIRGTAFQHRGVDALRRIPAGSTASYAEIAK